MFDHVRELLGGDALRWGACPSRVRYSGLVERLGVPYADDIGPSNVRGLGEPGVKLIAVYVAGGRDDGLVLHRLLRPQR